MRICLKIVDSFRIADFGIAHDEDLSTMTSLDEKVGSNWYLPPEAEEGRIEPTPAFDVYSLGKVLYTALAGGGRFRREDFRDPSVNLVNVFGRPELDSVNTLLGRMVVSDPALRFASMAAFVEALDRTAFLNTNSGSPSNSPPLEDPELRKIRRDSISQTWQKLRRVEDQLELLTRPARFSGEPSDDEYLKNSGEQINELVSLWDAAAIFLPELDGPMEAQIKLANRIVAGWRFGLGKHDASQFEARKEFESSWPKLRDALRLSMNRAVGLAHVESAQKSNR